MKNRIIKFRAWDGKQLIYLDGFKMFGMGSLLRLEFFNKKLLLAISMKHQN